MHDGIGAAGEREIDVMDDKAMRGCSTNKWSGESRGVGGGVSQGGEQVGVGGVVGRFQLVVDFFGEGLGEGEGGASRGARLPRPRRWCRWR